MIFKEKATELVETFENVLLFNVEGKVNFAAIQCAKASVDLILEQTGCGNCKESDHYYWSQVKKELENL